MYLPISIYVLKRTIVLRCCTINKHFIERVFHSSTCVRFMQPSNADGYRSFVLFRPTSGMRFEITYIYVPLSTISKLLQKRPKFIKAPNSKVVRTFLENRQKRLKEAATQITYGLNPRDVPFCHDSLVRRRELIDP